MLDVGDGLMMPEGGWNFAAVVEVFESHLRKSVPLCAEGRAYIADLSRFYLRPGSLVYELGVSTGALAREVLRQNEGRPLRYVGIDIVPAMAERAAGNLRHDPRFTAEVADVVTYRFEPASMFLSYYTVQFSPRRSRQHLFNVVCERLEPGGAFIMYEKVESGDTKFDEILARLHTSLKLAQGFRPEEIENKARALKGVLEPCSSIENLRMLETAGFRQVMVIFKFYCFEGYLAVR